MANAIMAEAEHILAMGGKSLQSTNVTRSHVSDTLLCTFSCLKYKTLLWPTLMTGC